MRVSGRLHTPAALPPGKHFAIVTLYFYTKTFLQFAPYDIENFILHTSNKYGNHLLVVFKLLQYQALY
jgi:hypothetical protein